MLKECSLTVNRMMKFLSGWWEQLREQRSDPSKQRIWWKLDTLIQNWDEKWRILSQNHFHPKNTFIQKPPSSQNHFHPKNDFDHMKAC